MTTKEKMNTNSKTAGTLDMKERLFTLWLFAILSYTYGDVVTLMDPIKHGTMEMTESFLLGGSIFMMIPISMVLLSRILSYRASRWASIIAGTIMTIALTLTLFVAVPVRGLDAPHVQVAGMLPGGLLQLISNLDGLAWTRRTGKQAKATAASLRQGIEERRPVSWQHTLLYPQATWKRGSYAAIASRYSFHSNSSSDWISSCRWFARRYRR